MTLTHCVSCDGVVPDSEERGSSANKEYNTETVNSSVTSRVELNTVRRYLLHHVDRSEVDQVLELFQGQLPLCSLCMELINRIYDFENEIDHIKSLIDDMVTFLKCKISRTLRSTSSESCTAEEKVFRIRILMAGKTGGPDISQRVCNQENELELDTLLTQVRTLFNRIETSMSIETGPDNSTLAPTGSPRPHSPALQLDAAPVRRSARRRKPKAKVLDDYGISDDEDNQSVGIPHDISSDPNNSDERHWERCLPENVQNESCSENEEEESDNQFIMSSEELKMSKTVPGKIPRWKQKRKTKRPRKTTKLGPDRYEFQGHKFGKTEEGAWKCETCSHTLKTRSSVLAHVKLSHLGESQGYFLCSFCGKTFTRLCGYTTHIAIHKNLKRYQCDVCGKAFVQHGNLIEHKLIHQGELNFCCKVEGCAHKFLRKRQLNLHMLKHIGQKSHMCELCGKGFIQRGDLTRHLRTHGGPECRQYTCDKCKKSFLTMSHLKRHRNNVHKTENEIPQKQDETPRATVFELSVVEGSTTRVIGEYLASQTFAGYENVP